ncbi:MAG TPA: methionine biosynthesis protein MetW [Solirubrobacterales bacterium]|nr:methionine biosynthesis protein MetW [Solirubrobacterales bacterium]
MRRSLARLRRPLPLADLQGDSFYDAYWGRRLDLEPDIVTTAPARARIVSEFVQPGWSVLDLGCGDGSFLHCLGQVVPGIQARGADVSDRALEQARARGIDAVRLDLADPGAEVPGTADVVTALEVIEHLPDAERAVLKAAAAAHRYLIVSVPNLGFVESRARLLLGRGPNTNVVHHVREHLRQWTVRDFREWAEHLGLRIVAERPTRPVGFMRLGRLMPALFSSGMLYVIEGRSTNE